MTLFLSIAVSFIAWTASQVIPWLSLWWIAALVRLGRPNNISFLFRSTTVFPLKCLPVPIFDPIALGVPSDSILVRSLQATNLRLCIFFFLALEFFRSYLLNEWWLWHMAFDYRWRVLVVSIEFWLISANPWWSLSRLLFMSKRKVQAPQEAVIWY